MIRHPPSGRVDGEAIDLDELADILGRVHDAPDRAEACVDALRRATGFDHLVVAGFRGRGIGTGNILRTTWPAAFRRAYLDSQAYLADPVVEALKRARWFVKPSDIALVAESQAAFRRNMDLRRAAGMTLPTGVVVQERGEPVGSVTISRAEPFSPRELAVLLALAPEIHRAARVGPIRRETGVDRLTPRERECLAWAAEGKTAWETSVILGLSERTVVTHLTAAGQKLGAANRVHAAVIATRAGLLDPHRKGPRERIVDAA